MIDTARGYLIKINLFNKLTVKVINFCLFQSNCNRTCNRCYFKQVIVIVLVTGVNFIKVRVIVTALYFEKK